MDQKKAKEFVQCVNGLIPPEAMGVCDAHNHVWIAWEQALSSDAPVLDDEVAIAVELGKYKQAGGGGIVDCQPGGCGRDTRRLKRFSRASGIRIVACTGFHLPKYYLPNYWLFSASFGTALEYFVHELTCGTEETVQDSEPVRAGFIKVGCLARLEDIPPALLQASAEAACQTNCAIELHTERGSQVERYVAYFLDQGVLPGKIVACHVDKRPDIGLHYELARSGVLLEYDTFFRPQYEPERNLWPLIEDMLSRGMGSQIALATDMAEPRYWSSYHGYPGLASLITIIRPRLESIGATAEDVVNLTGANISRALASSFWAR